MCTYIVNYQKKKKNGLPPSGGEWPPLMYQNCADLAANISEIVLKMEPYNSAHW